MEIFNKEGGKLTFFCLLFLVEGRTSPSAASAFIELLVLVVEVRTSPSAASAFLEIVDFGVEERTSPSAASAIRANSSGASSSTAIDTAA